MSGTPRNELANPHKVEYQHTWSRCVTGHWTFGVDPLYEQDFRHRKQWVEGLLEYLASIFAIDVLSYHILCNHLHAMLRNRPDLVKEWTDLEVLIRWRLLWPRFIDGVWVCEPSDAEIDRSLMRAKADPTYIEKVRTNLSSISWFMGRWKELIAKQVNFENKGGGHVWAERFGNRRITTAEDLVTAMIYNDTQQVRAGIVTSVEQSNFSAIQRQIMSSTETAENSFQRVHRRRPGSETDDATEIKRIQAMYASCFISPINAEPQIFKGGSAPISELLYPPIGSGAYSGYIVNTREAAEAARELFRSKHSSATPVVARHSVEDEPSEASLGEDVIPEAVEGSSDDGVSPETNSCAEQETRIGTEVQRSQPKKRSETFNFHREFKRRQRRRASTVSAMEIPFNYYLDLVVRSAERTAHESELTRDPLGPNPGCFAASANMRTWRLDVSWVAVSSRNLSDFPADLPTLSTPEDVPRGDRDG